MPPKAIRTKFSLGVLFLLAVGCAKPEVGKLVFVTQPASSFATDALGAVTVQLQDKGGNPIKDATASVTMSVSSGSLGGTTSVAGVAGVATFSDLHVDSAGTGLVLTASVGGVSVQSQPFSVTGLALKFDVQPATFAAPKTALGVKVHLNDSNGAEVPLAHRTVTVKLQSAGPTLGGTTSRDVSSGVADFNDLNVDVPSSNVQLVVSTPGAPDLLSSSFTVAYSRDEIEPLNKGAPNAKLNDTFGTAEALTMGIPTFGTLADIADKDFYTFTATAGQMLHVTLFATRLDQANWQTDVHVTLLKADGTTPLFRNGSVEASWDSADYGLQQVQIPTTGTYYLALAVDGAGTRVGKYAVLATLKPPPGLQKETELAGTTGDNDTRGTAQLIGAGTLQGYWEGGGSPGKDYYAINVSGPTRVHLQLSAERNGYYANDSSHYDPEVYLLDGSGDLGTTDGVQLWDNDDSLFYDSGIDYLLATAGEYYVKVDRCCATGAAPYFIAVDETPLSFTAEVLPNTTSITATAIPYGQYTSGTITAAEAHYFKFVGNAGDMVRIRPFDVTTQNATLTSLTPRLYDTDGSTLLTQASGFSDYNLVQTILQKDGTFFVKIVGSAPGTFSFQLEKVKGASYEVEPNSAPITNGIQPQANNLDGNGRAAGVIGQPGDLDNFGFQAGAGELVSVSLYGNSGNNDAAYEFSEWGSAISPKLQIYDRTGALLSESLFAWTGLARGDAESMDRPEPMLEVSFRAPTAGSFYAVVSNTNPAVGDATYFYELELHRTE